MGFDDICSPGLVLGLGIPSTEDNHKPRKPSLKTEQSINFEPSLTLSLFGSEAFDKKSDAPPPADDLHRQDSAASSFSNGSVKRERELLSEEVEIERNSSRVISDEDEDGGGSNSRKKLRLTKAQSALLEESFKQHSTLNPLSISQKQKQDLARELNLRPRQVEVWFQNRRARTKLKQTEVDCEFLKKCCETLTDENRRLQKELQELKALKLAQQPLYMQLPAATLTMCPSCERVGGGGGGGGGGVGENASKNHPLIAMASKPHFFNPFTSPSAAC
ncbi:hypothetical protein ACH5RR_011582 [Cinchona calisaya]|uniref:Homeobox domain-containing protein n=1 Tax=Cinchona calisaya TaxID=153742 RepID=A0ABD3A5B2_9GENT